MAQVVTGTCLEVLEQGPTCYYSAALLQALLFICKLMAKKPPKKPNILNCLNCGYLQRLCFADEDDDQHEKNPIEYHRYESQEPNRDYKRRKEDVIFTDKSTCKHF